MKGKFLIIWVLVFRVKWVGILVTFTCILIAGMNDSASFAGSSSVEHMIQMLHAEVVTFLESDIVMMFIGIFCPNFGT